MVAGTLAHKDSMGNGRQLKPGQIQLMSAGSGVQHSEFNPSATEPAHFLQIWIKPEAHGLPPSYTEWHPSEKDAANPKVLVISRDGRDGSAVIHQDASIYRIRLASGQSVSHDVLPGRGVWLQVIKGSLTANGSAIEAGDGAVTDDTGMLEITAAGDAEALLFDLK